MRFINLDKEEKKIEQLFDRTPDRGKQIQMAHDHYDANY